MFINVYKCLYTFGFNRWYKHLDGTGSGAISWQGEQAYSKSRPPTETGHQTTRDFYLDMFWKRLWLQGNTNTTFMSYQVKTFHPQKYHLDQRGNISIRICHFMPHIWQHIALSCIHYTMSDWPASRSSCHQMSNTASWGSSHLLVHLWCSQHFCRTYWYKKV